MEMKVLNPWTRTMDTVTIERAEYRNNKALALSLYDAEDGCPYATLTVNLPDSAALAENEAYIDTNNCPWAEALILENKLGNPTGRYGRSGFCMYPLYSFDLSKIPA